MSNIPNNITRDDMIWAIKQIDSGKPLVTAQHRSDRHCLEYPEGRTFKHFPPKEVISQANLLPNGTELRDFFGGDETNDFCKYHGFTINNCGQAPH